MSIRIRPHPNSARLFRKRLVNIFIIKVVSNHFELSPRGAFRQQLAIDQALAVDRRSSLSFDDFKESAFRVCKS